MKKHYNSKALIVSTITLLAALIPAQAATINWGTATNISGISDVSTNGDLVYAVNFGTPGYNYTLNGVTFIGASQTGIANVLTTTAANYSRDGFKATSAPFTTMPSDYQSVLQSAISTSASSGNPGSFVITLEGLTIGSTYELQLWANDSRSRSPGTGYPYSSVIIDSSATLRYNTAAAAGGLGQYITGTFTADATTQSLTFTSADSANAQAMINALQLRQIPEASTYALIFSICALAIVGLRRRLR